MSESARVAQVSPLLVTPDSSDASLPSLCLASYTPVLGDRVAVEKFGSQTLVLGKVV